MSEQIVITGSGIVCSIGIEMTGVWDRLLSGKHGIHPIRGYDVSGFKNQMAAQTHGIDPDSLNIHPRDSRIMNKHSHMLMKCSLDAIKEAGLHEHNISGDEIGFYAGMGMVDYEVEDLLASVVKSMDPDNNLNYERFFSKGYQEIYPLWPLSMLNNIGFCQVAIRLGISGDNTVFSPHADSGVQAIAEAIAAVRQGKTAVALAGGVSEKITPLSLARDELIGEKNENHAVLGEGCGMMVLEPRSLADARGADYNTSISGYGFSFNLDEAAAAPAVNAVMQSMKQALDTAGLKPEDIDLIITHRDVAGAGNKNEIEAVLSVFASCLDKIKCFSTKGILGNLLAAAPVVDAIVAMEVLKEGVIPASINAPCAAALDEMRFRVISENPLDALFRRILINCQSYEGQCASLILEKMNSVDITTNKG